MKMSSLPNVDAPRGPALQVLEWLNCLDVVGCFSHTSDLHNAPATFHFLTLAKSEHLMRTLVLMLRFFCACSSAGPVFRVTPFISMWSPRISLSPSSGWRDSAVPPSAFFLFLFPIWTPNPSIYQIIMHSSFFLKRKKKRSQSIWISPPGTWWVQVFLRLF